MEIIIITGMSGAGKTQASKCLEDIGYYCIDNMPPALIKNFVDINTNKDINKVAFVIDIRGGEFFDDLKESLSELNVRGFVYKILFLEAEDDTIISRFKETRRNHPLAKAGDMRAGIRQERKKLADIKKISDYIMDTSNLKIAKLDQELKKLILEDGSEKDYFNLTFKSFGYKQGVPRDTDIVFDVRFLPNPFYLVSMKKLTGNNKKVQDYVMRGEGCKEFVKRVHDLIEYLIPFYIKKGKSSLVISFGCTGGQHRSVTMANVFSKLFLDEGKRVITIHREL